MPNVTVTPNTTFTFYDLAFTDTNEIDQISAVSDTGEQIDLIVQTAVRRNNSPIISTLRPMVYMIVANKPRIALERFITWVNSLMYRQTDSKGSESDVVLVAHNGMCHDHVMLLKTMMIWRLNPPKWRLADSLPFFKIVTRPNEECTLPVLATVYAPWSSHIQHDALSDSRALRYVVTSAVENWQLACLVFSSSSEYFITSVGLNMIRVREPLPFPNSSDI